MSYNYKDRRGYDARYSEQSTVSSYLNRVVSIPYMHTASQRNYYREGLASKTDYLVMPTFSAYDLSNVGRANPHDLAAFRTVDVYDLEYDRPVLEIHDWLHDGFVSPRNSFRPRASSLCRKSPITCANLFDITNRHGLRESLSNR